MRSVVVLLAIAACGQYHVRLDPPRPDITPQERVELFWKLRPTAEGFVKADGQLVNHTMFLGDKDKIEVVSPEDLEPLVGSDSETMQYARASVSARGKARTTLWVGLATTIAGFLMTGWLADAPPFGLPNAWVGAGVMVGGLLVMYPINRYYTREELTLRKQAFGVYTRDLGERLNVCAQGTQVVACETPSNAPAPPRDPTPATSVPGRTALRMRR